jgi:nucleotide-binding universal stress UspA family protein
MDKETIDALLSSESKGAPQLDLDVVRAASTSKGIIAESQEADLLVLGAAREGILNQLVFGEKTRSIAETARCTVLLTKRRAGKGRSLLRRLLTKQE